jgi:methylated-DNA-[protein]-cysteine S-methyltransferase
MNLSDDKHVYWTHFIHDTWQMHIAATSKGLCYVNSPHASIRLLADWAAKHYPSYSLVQDDDRMSTYADQLKEYFQGVRREFTLPLDLQGTSFQQSVWDTLLAMSHGETQAYSEIAEAVGKPKAVRAVGAAIGANPVLIVVPCHRVIGKKGALTGYRGGNNAKTGLLRLEGIPVGK